MQRQSLTYLSNLVQSNPQLLDLTIPKLTEYIPHTPTTKQQAFLLLNNLDSFYGGAAGGGKSDALLMAALQYVDVPGYNALLLRDSFKNLAMPEALMDRAEEWLQPTDAEWKDKKCQWVFPKYRSSLTFGYLTNVRDHLQYKSSAFQFIGIDEASDLRWKQIRYMFSRLRKLKKSKVPIRFRLASNPGGVSHEHLLKHYIDPRTRKKGVVFISSTMEDNPYLDREGYGKALDELDVLEKQRLKFGDWTIKEQGRMFDRTWFVIREFQPNKKDIKRTVRYWDLASSEPTDGYKEPDYTVGGKFHLLHSGLIVVSHLTIFRKSSAYTERTVRHTAEADGVKVPIWFEQDPGSAGKMVIDNFSRKVLPGYVVYGNRVTGHKTERARLPSSKAEKGEIEFVRAPWNEPALDQLEMFPNSNHDDIVDVISGGVQVLTQGINSGHFVDSDVYRGHEPILSGLSGATF